MLLVQWINLFDGLNSMQGGQRDGGKVIFTDEFEVCDPTKRFVSIILNNRLNTPKGSVLGFFCLTERLRSMTYKNQWTYYKIKWSMSSSNQGTHQI